MCEGGEGEIGREDRKRKEKSSDGCRGEAGRNEECMGAKVRAEHCQMVLRWELSPANSVPGLGEEFHQNFR